MILFYFNIETLQLKEMRAKSEQDSQSSNSDEDNQKRPRRQTKNQQIYGDFYQAYQPEPQKHIYTRANAYQQFKAGATIETYSSEVEIDLPKAKPKFTLAKEDVEDDRPMLGKFSLNSFLNQLDGNDLDQINQSDNQDSSQNKPEGLNEKILVHLQLVKAGQEIEQAPDKIEDMNFSQYMREVKHGKNKVEPKYKTPEERQLAKQFQEGYGVGFKMMEKMGFKVNKGLGKQLSGIHRPVEAVFKTAFTLKDQQERPKAEGEDQNSQESAITEEQISIPQKLFQFRSRSPQINNFLLSLKNSYEKLQSQIYFYSREIESFEKEEELNVSLKCQKQNEIGELNNQIAKLSEVQNNIYDCQLYPHLGSHYKLDMLYVKQLYQKLSVQTFQWLCINAEKQLRKLTSSLSKFYLAKTKQTVREYHKSTSIEERINKNLTARKRQEKQVIDLDQESKQDSDFITLSPEDQDRIAQFIDVLFTRTIIPQINTILSKVSSIDKVNDLRVIQLIEVVKKFDGRGHLLKGLIKDYLEPLCSQYLQTVSLQDLQQEGIKKLPHLILFPWLTIMPPVQLHLMNFYQRLAGNTWNIESSNLYNIVSPLLKFSTPREINFFTNLYLAPRLLHELQKFSINQANVALLNGFTKYSQFLSQQTKQDILQNTVAVQIRSAYLQYKTEMSGRELQKWLSRWRKFTDRILPGFLDGQFEQISIGLR